MPKKETDSGAANMKAVLDNKSALANLSDDQLGALGGSRDPLDAEDFSEADFGNEVTPPQSDDKPGDEAADKDDAKADAKDDAKDEDDSDEGDDGESNDSDDATAADDEKSGEDEGDSEKDGDKADADADGDSADASKDGEKAGEDADGDEDDDTKGKGKGKDQDQRVPLERFREVNKRMRDAEKRLEQMEREIAAGKGKGEGDGKDAAPAYDFDKAESEYQDLVLDGKKQDAIAKRREIRAAERADFQKDADTAGNKHAEASHAKRELDTIALKFEGEYAEMDEAHENFNPEVNLEVEALMLGYLQTGMPAPKAFEKACQRAVKLFDLKPIAEPTPESKDKGKVDDKDKAKFDKKAKAGKDKAKKAKGAPPDTSKVGDPGDGGSEGKGKLDYENMSEEEFNALPKSTIARLRGDIL